MVLDRVDASPVQVDVADRLFDGQPLGSPDVLTTLDPAAACVAAAHWLAAAADVAADAANIDPTGVFTYADDIEAVSVEVPTLVVEAILDDATPRETVLRLLADAVAVRNGRIPDPSALAKHVDDARDKAAVYPPAHREELVSGLLDRITPIDPLRPARHLLEHLLDGLNSCLLTYRDHARARNEDDLDGEGVAEFVAAVRERARDARARLG